ncbi:MAG TPA: MMPL family transporter, partial [Acidimicrobiales bacterium]
AKLQDTSGVLNVISPLTGLDFTQALVDSPTGDPTQSVAGKALLGARERETDPAKQAIRLEDAGVTLQRLNTVPADQRTLENPEWVRFLLFDNEGNIRKPLLPFFPDENHAQTITRLVGNASLEDEGKAADAVINTTDASMDNATVITTGAPELLNQINDYLRGGMLTLGAIAVGIMIVILLVLFDVRWRLLPLAVILIGVIWAFGLAGYMGIPLSVVTISGLPVMLGIGIDYAIQMHSRIEEEVLIARATHPIQETARNLGPALLVVTFDAIFAFAALRFAKVPMIRDFGLLLAVGIAAICLCSIIMPLSILGIREYRSPTKGRDFREGPLGRLVLWLGSLPGNSGPILAVASLVIFVAGMAVEGKLVLQTDPERWVNQDSAVIKKINTLNAEVGSSSELGVFVRSDQPFSDETVAFVDGFARKELEERPNDLLTASSVVTTVSFLLDMPGASTLAPTGADVQAAYEVAPRDIQLSTANVDAGALNLIFRTGKGSLDERAVYVKDIRQEIKAEDLPNGLSATPSGLSVVGVGLLDNLEGNRILLTYLAIAFVGIFLAFRLRSVVRSLLSLVPVLIAVGLASLVAWIFSLQLSPMTAVGGPLVVAACTEFTSLILLRYLEERRRGLEPRAAVNATAVRTGRAFIVSACTAIAGVAVIAFSSLPLLRDFGLIVAMNVTVALLSALVILPPLLVWADQRGWVSRGMLGDRTPEDRTPKDLAPTPAD